jgi:uncharacterized protein involved in exopolysaccharide biosynthesis
VDKRRSQASALAYTSPERAARIANAYAEAYVASNLDKRFDANSYAKAFLEEQIEQLKKSVTAPGAASL